MSQMVLPQNLSNSAPPETAKSSGSARPGNEKSGESSYDAVSRSEQKRLDARQASDARAAKDATQARQEQRAEDSRQADTRASEKNSEKTGTEKPTETRAAEGKPATKEPSGEDRGQDIAGEDLPKETPILNPELLTGADGESFAQAPDEAAIDAIDSVPVTFAGLQSLIASAQTARTTETAATAAKGAGAQTNSQGLPFVQGSMLSMAGLNGSGKPGAMMLQQPGQGGSAPGLALTENLLAGVTGEGGKASDSPILQNAIRFQGALESVSAQANAVNTPKMAPDAPILRGYTTSIDVPVSHAEWGDKMAGKLTWLTARNMSVAEIHLTPPDMGPMEVKVSVQQDQANIQVHSANPVVREQLELHSHRLRDMLSEQGLSLEQFDVSDSGSDQTRDGESGSGEPTGTGVIADAESEESLGEPGSLDLTWKGEVDIFA